MKAGSLTGRIRSRATYLNGILTCVSGVRSKAAALKIAFAGRSGETASADEAVPIRMRACGGEPFYVRPGSSDLLNAVAYYRYGSELPPPGVDDPRTIVELGTNCGVVLTALGIRYPQARLLGVEPDAGNAAAAKRNLERFGDRAEVVNGAIWDVTVELTADRSPASGEHGIVVRPSEPGDPPEWTRLEGITIDDILDRHLPGDDPIDYMHITIEGSEARVLAKGGRWTDRVHSLRIELHSYFDFGSDKCIAQLEALGYRAYAAEHPPETWVFGFARD